MIVERSLGETGKRGDLIYTDPGKTLAVEQLIGGVEYAAPGPLRMSGHTPTIGPPDVYRLVSLHSSRSRSPMSPDAVVHREPDMNQTVRERVGAAVVDATVAELAAAFGNRLVTS